VVRHSDGTLTAHHRHRPDCALVHDDVERWRLAHDLSLAMHSKPGPRVLREGGA
jgi:hypothetical protein